MQLVWSVVAAAGLPATDVSDGAHTQVPVHPFAVAPLAMFPLIVVFHHHPIMHAQLQCDEVTHAQALHGFGDVYQDDYWVRKFSSACSSAALKCKGATCCI